MRDGLNVTAAAGPDSDPEAIGGPAPEECDQFRPEQAPEGLLVMIEQGVLTRISIMEPSTLRTDRGFGLGATAAEIKAAGGNLTAAQSIYREALQNFPQAKSLIYGYAASLYAGKKYDEAARFLDSQLQLYASDYKLYGLQAKTYAAQGKRLQQFKAQAEFYMLQGQLTQAVEQLQFAQKETDGNFYEQSEVDARLRELRVLQAEEAKLKRNGL